MRHALALRPFFSTFLLVVGLIKGILNTLPARAQTGSEGRLIPGITHAVVLRGGYTAGRFSHSTDDYRPSLNLFGSGNNGRTGYAVGHRFYGALLGADYSQESHRPGSTRTIALLAGLDVLGATDRLTIGNNRQATLRLGAVHPHFGLGLRTKHWALNAGFGVLAGRLGYYGATTSGLVSDATVIDTVSVRPTFHLQAGYNNWVLLESGYGANGLLGLANPVWTAGLGTGFGPSSSVALLVGVTEPESTDFATAVGGFGYARLLLAPRKSQWQATAFVTFGSQAYGRAALQASYRLPLGTVGTAPAQ